MKKISILALLVFACSLVLASRGWAQLPGSLTDGLVSYYPFEGNANDVVGTNNATAVGVTLTSGITGAPNSAYYFSGTMSYLTAPFTPPTNNSFTWSLWINATTIKETYYFMAGNINENAGGKSFFMLPTGQVGFNSYDDALSGEENFLINSLQTPTPIQSNIWTHLAITSDTNNLRTFYVNGVAMTNKVSSGYGQLGISNFLFGADRFLREELSLQGSMDDVTIYDRPLSPSEVTDLYNAQLVPEPSTYALLLLSGAVSLWALKRRKS